MGPPGHAPGAQRSYVTPGCAVVSVPWHKLASLGFHSFDVLLLAHMPFHFYRVRTQDMHMHLVLLEVMPTGCIRTTQDGRPPRAKTACARDRPDLMKRPWLGSAVFQHCSLSPGQLSRLSCVLSTRGHQPRTPPLPKALGTTPGPHTR